MNPFLTETRPNLSSQALPNFHVGHRLPAQCRVYDSAGNVIAEHEHKGDSKEW